MRQPRQPRAPRAPRGEAPAEGAIPPPGFSVPVAGARYPGAGPRPPGRAGATATTIGAPAIAPGASSPMPAASLPAGPPGRIYPPAPAPLVDDPPAGPAIAAETTNAYSQQSATREFWRGRSTRNAQPQGETQLVHAWLQVLTVRKIPPHACTLWLTRVEPQPTYEFFVPGDAVLGEHPDRALYEYVAGNRRQRDVAERFVGRIRAPAADGSPIELGGGELYLPPSPAAPPGPSWSTPGAAPAWAQSPYGAPPWGGGAMGMPPPWWGGGGGGMPPWWGTPPLSALMAAQRPPPPPATVQQDPAALRAWEMMSQNQATLLQSVLELATRTQPAPAAAAAQPDMWGTLEKVISITEKLRGPPAAEESGIKVIRLDDDTTLVTDKKGDIDTGATAWANMKGIKGVFSGLKSLRTPPGAGGAGGQGGGGGPRPPGRAALTTPKANGAPS